MPRDNLTKDEIKAMLLLVADRIIEAEPILTDADRNLGDGDHGLGMQRGFTAVKAKLEGKDFESIEKVFSSGGMAMISSMGGASGAIFGTFFRNGGKAVAGKESFGAEELAAFLAAAEEGIKDRGGAKPGDKTMIDALHPAAEKAKDLAGGNLEEALRGAAEAAEEGKEASKAMVAAVGRAKTLGERSVGHPDAGAVSISLIMKAMHEFVAT